MRLSRRRTAYDCAVSASLDIAPDAAGTRLARVELAAALRAAALYGFNEGIDNHFSLVVPGRADAFLLNPYGPHWSELRASDLLTIGLGGERLAGEGELDMTAFTIHLGAHRARPDAACVLHTHMPYATALAMTERGLDTRASQNSMAFHGRVTRLAYAGLADAEEEGARIARALIDGITVLLMDNHGVLVVGDSVADAWHQLYFLERACQVQVLAQSTGSPVLRVPEEVARHTAAQFRSAGGQPELFAAVRRELDRVNPGYDR
jgi:ribulose-5-phosphate 4-epimerase/fuculose-1-phosphate aldolase